MGNLGDLSPQGSVAVGVIVGLISTSLQAIGLTLQRKSHILEDEKHPYDLRRPPYKRRRWQLGMLMFVVSNIVGSTIQITTLPLPVLSTLQASGLVFNTIFATLVLGEAFTSTSILYPFVFCIYNVIAILDGLIYFRQLSQLAGFHAGLIALGTVVLLSGVLCLSWRLEIIESHACETVVGPSQTGLGPGIAFLEEHPHSPREVGAEDEELHIGERQPLLQASHPPHGFPHRRAPSLPSVSSIPQQTPSADIDPASIWAELDDSDYEYTGTGPRWQPRPRSSTLRESVLRGPRHSTIGAVGQHAWTNRRHTRSVYEGHHQRRTSILGPDNRQSLQKRSTYFSPLPGNHPSRSIGYGTSGESERERGHEGSTHLISSSGGHEPLQLSATPSSDGPLAGSRNALAQAWRNGLQYLSRWSRHRPRTGSDSHDPLLDSSHSPST
ncbi:hypothetical protein KXX31_002184 [Aspergillus fumigatus]|nr:hypothetical protein KXX31_002184 [Aspergillus fumigatus]